MEPESSEKNLTISFFIIKPEALEFKKDIYDYIEKYSSLDIVETRKVVLGLEDLKSIYIDDLDSDLMSAITNHLSGRKVIIGVVRGRKAVVALEKLCGDHYNPKQCESNTLRYKFGSHNIINYDNIPYFLNGIHKVSNTEINIVISWYENRFNTKKEELLSFNNNSSS